MSRLSMCPAARIFGVFAFAWTAFAFAAIPGAGETRPRTANAAPCEACHGTHGEGQPAAAIPRLAGQSADYLEKQLRDYESGTRDNPVMRNFAKGLSDSERAQLSRYYASLSAPAPHAVQVAPMDQRQWARGQQLAHQGAEAERVQGC